MNNNKFGLYYLQAEDLFYRFTFSKGSPHSISGPFEPLCRVLFTFPSLYFFAIGLHNIFSFSGDLPAY